MPVYVDTEQASVTITASGRDVIVTRQRPGEDAQTEVTTTKSSRAALALAREIAEELPATYRRAGRPSDG